MTVGSEPLAVLGRPGRAVSLGRWLDRESVFSWLMMALPLLFLAAFVGYPFFYGILLSLQDRPVAQTGTFVGVKNLIADFHDPVVWHVTCGTFVYTGPTPLV